MAGAAQLTPSPDFPPRTPTPPTASPPRS